MVGIWNFFLALASTVCLSPVCDNRRIASSFGIGARHEGAGRKAAPVAPSAVSLPESCPSVPVEGRFSSRSSVSFPADFTPAGVRRSLGAALAGVVLGAFLFAIPAAHAADECGDPVEQSDGSWLIHCTTSNYTSAEGDIVYEQDGDDIGNNQTQVLHLDDVNVTPLSGDSRAAVWFHSPGQRNRTNIIVKMTDSATVSTSGAGHEGILTHNFNEGGGTGAAGAARLIMEDFASISTLGSGGAHGAWIERDAPPGGAAYNTGTVEATIQDNASISTTGSGSHAIYGNSRRSEGPIKIHLKDSASLSTTGGGSHGMYLFKLNHNFNRDNIEAKLEGKVSITTSGGNAHGIYMRRETGRDGDMEVEFTGGENCTDAECRISVTGAGSRAIYLGQHGDSGESGQTIRLRVLISDATVKSAQAQAIFLANDEGRDPKTLILRNATVERTNANNTTAVFFSQSGPANNTAAADEVIILGGPEGANTTTIKGNVDVNYGTDTLTLNACTSADRAGASSGEDCHRSPDSGDLAFIHDGRFISLDRVDKIGSGTASIHDLDVSHGNAPLNLKNGALLLDGHLNLGTGVLTIHDTARLVFASTPDEHGRITAAKVKFDDDVDEKIYLAVGASLAANSDLLLGNTRFHDHQDTETSVELYANVASGETKLSNVFSGGTVETASSVTGDGNECGAPPTTGDPRTIACNNTTYNVPNGGDSGIEYEFDDANNYKIDVSGTIDVDTAAAGDHGLHAKHTGSGNLSVNMTAGAIDTAGGWRDYGIFAESTSSDTEKRDVSISMSGGSIGTAGQYSHGLFARRDAGADNDGVGDLTVTMSGGSIQTIHQEAHGILAERGSGAGAITIGMSGGSIDVSDDGSHGISARQEGAGDLAVTMSGGSILTGDHRYSNYRKAGRGIDALHKGSSGNISISLSGNADIKTGQRGADSPTVVGDEAHGIFAKKEGSQGDITVRMNDGDVTTGKEVDAGTTGRGADGIHVWQTTAGNSEVSLTNGATVTVTDPSAWGIRIRHGANTGTRHVTVADSTIAAASSSARAIRIPGWRCQGRHPHIRWGR